MTKIRINDLKVRTLIGAYPWERVNKQELVINITIDYDSTQACRTDKLKDALNYETVATQTIKTVERSRYTLLEKLVSKLLAGIMSDQRVEAAFVRIDKPQALSQARSISVELSAKR